MAQTAEDQQEKAAAQSAWLAQKLHRQHELARPLPGNLQRPHLSASMCSVNAACRNCVGDHRSRRTKMWTTGHPTWRITYRPVHCRSGRSRLGMDNNSGPAGQDVRSRESRTAVEALQIVRCVFDDIVTLGGSPRNVLHKSSAARRDPIGLFLRTGKVV